MASLSSRANALCHTGARRACGMAPAVRRNVKAQVNVTFVFPSGDEKVRRLERGVNSGCDLRTVRARYAQVLAFLHVTGGAQLFGFLFAYMHVERWLTPSLLRIPRVMC